jgi:SAM-dependent methyltransferase
MHHRCIACRSEFQADALPVREMMFGTRREYGYLACTQCGCLQRTEPPQPSDFSYSSTYYSFAAAQAPRKIGRFKTLLKREWYRSSSHTRSPVGGLLRLIKGKPPLPHWFLELDVHPAAGILDVGCGSGAFLQLLARFGFTNLTGIDPYLPETISADGIRLLRTTLADLAGRFDLITLNHSFEHLEDPHAALAKIRTLLTPSGLVCIRVPVAGKFAWREYGTNWVQIDAPRHLFIPSIESMKFFAQAHEFGLGSVEFDSTGFQFWGSELYRREIALTDSDKKIVDPGSFFGVSDLAQFEQRAKDLNMASDGDQACFVFRPQ